MENPSPRPHQNTQGKKNRKTWKFIISAIFSVLVGFFPSIMPDTIKTKLSLLLGSNYEIIWITIFVSISILLIWFSYLLWKKENKYQTGIKVTDINSGGIIKLNSEKDGDFSAEKLESEKSIDLTIVNDGDVDIKGLKSNEDTIIDIKKSK